MRKTQLKFLMNKHIKEIMIALMCTLLCIPFFSNAQHDTSSRVDTSEINEDKSDYVPTHYYDSSQKYFNWKDEFNDPFTTSPIVLTASYSTFIDSLKKSKDFDYVSKIEAFQQRQVTLQKRADSLGKEGKNKELLPEQVLIDGLSPIFQFLFHPVTQYIIWAVIVGIFLCGILFFLTENKISIWGRNDEKYSNSDNIVGDDVNIFQLNYQDLLQKALAEGNLRLYIRIQYLQTIKLLSENQLIQFKPEHTNFVYLLQMQKSKLYPIFFTITRHYEYVWYGKFDVSDIAFNSISKEIEQFQQQIKQS